MIRRVHRLWVGRQTKAVNYET